MADTMLEKMIVKVTLPNGRVITSTSVESFFDPRDPYIEFHSGAEAFYLKTKADIACGMVSKVEVTYPDGAVVTFE